MNYKITPENLISALEGNEPNIEIGGWSRYALADMAMPHYFPDKYANDNSPLPSELFEMTKEIDCQYWEDVIKKYHSEVGYSQEQLNNTQLINEY